MKDYEELLVPLIMLMFIVFVLPWVIWGIIEYLDWSFTMMNRLGNVKFR